MSQESNQVAKIGLCQISVGSDKQSNINNASSWVKKAADQGAKLVVLPECFNCPYGTKFFPDYAEEIPSMEDQNSAVSENTTFGRMSRLARELSIYLVAGSIPEREGGKLYNTSMSFNPSGRMIAKHRKVHLFDIDVPGKIRFMESEALSPGDSIANSIFETDMGLKVGVGICFDVRFPEMAQIYQQKGCNLLVYPGAFNTTTGPAHWDLLARGRAVDNQLFVAMCSPARDTTSSYVAYGHSLVVDPWGSHVGRAEHGEQLLMASLDVAKVEAIRQQIPATTNKRLDMYTLPSLK